MSRLAFLKSSGMVELYKYAVCWAIIGAGMVVVVLAAQAIRADMGLDAIPMP